MPAPIVDTTPELVSRVYKKLAQRTEIARKRLGRSLTLAEKIFFGHVAEPRTQAYAPGESYLRLDVDRVIMQDATAQMAILQFIQAGRETVAIPTTVHCDHLIQAFEGAGQDLSRARVNNQEVYEFLRSACSKYGIGFWGPGSGIIHQVVLENYAFPGGLIIGSDSHTPNMGGLGMIAIGVGGADTVDVMAGFEWEVLQPKLVGVRLTGELSGWTAPKDVILKVAGELTVKGGTNRVIEYFGPGARSLSATGRGTITNMGAEIGATTSIFPFDAWQGSQGDAYLRATDREQIAELAIAHAALLSADPDVEEHPEKYFDQIIDIDLSRLEPHIVGPFTPDLARPVSKLAEDARKMGYPPRISASMVGSCTNSSYEDISRAAEIAEQARVHGAHVSVPLMVTPGSALVFETVKRDGQLASLESIGAQVMANACGPCIGQWKRSDVKKGERNTIVNSYNRNFPGRNDDNPETLAFVASPEVVMAFALAGTLLVDPLNQEFTTADGKKLKLSPPSKVAPLPARGFLGRKTGYEPPADDPSSVTLRIPQGSERLHVLEPFEPIAEPELSCMPVLIKTKGKTTTDHISPAGPWLRFRGNLDRISDNLFLGAINAWTGERGKTINVLTGAEHRPIAEVARAYKAAHQRWIAVGDENYGEGSSREHAAMSPRYLGAAAIVARSFARIHESNLKKQGILPLTFVNPADYEKIRQGDRVNLEYLKELDPNRSINMLVQHADGTSEVITLVHTLNMEHLAWFHAGSALNLLRKQRAA